MRSMLLGGLALLALVLGGCAAETPPPGGGTQPAPAPSGGLATVEQIDLLALESFPVQIHAVVRGSLPDTCTEIDQVSQTRDGNTFKITLTTRRTAEDCPQTGLLNRFEETIPLDVYGLPAGTYTVDANGVTQTFDLTSDNILPSAPGDQPATPGAILPPVTPGSQLPGGSGDTETGLAMITGADVQVSGAAPPTITVTIYGYLPDGCTTLSNIQEEWIPDQSTIRLTVETRRPRDVACIQIIQEFAQTYALQTALGHGAYTLVINDFVTQFSLN